MVEVVNQIRTAEEQADEVKKSARQQARIVLDEAHAAGKQQVESARQEATAQSAGIVSQSEAGAQAYLQQHAAKSRDECQQLIAGAEAKLPKAAGFIVERIVERL